MQQRHRSALTVRPEGYEEVIWTDCGAIHSPWVTRRPAATVQTGRGRKAVGTRTFCCLRRCRTRDRDNRDKNEDPGGTLSITVGHGQTGDVPVHAQTPSADERRRRDEGN